MEFILQMQKTQQTHFRMKISVLGSEISCSIFKYSVLYFLNTTWKLAICFLWKVIFFALLSSALLSFEALLNTVSAAVLLSFN